MIQCAYCSELYEDFEPHNTRTGVCILCFRRLGEYLPVTATEMYYEDIIFSRRYALSDDELSHNIMNIMMLYSDSIKDKTTIIMLFSTNALFVMVYSVLLFFGASLLNPITGMYLGYLAFSILKVYCIRLKYNFKNFFTRVVYLFMKNSRFQDFLINTL